MTDLRERFEAFRFSTVEQMLTEKRGEDLHLEFKSLENPEEFSSSDRSNLARALSAFANSDGGIVIWGVRMTRVSGVECAELQALPLYKTIARLNELESDAVNPTIAGVTHKALERSDGDETGIVATLIPRSDRLPHMAKFKENRYYKRNGHKSLPCEHFDIENMFGRRPLPALTLFSRIHVAKGYSPNTVGPHYDCSVVIGINNEGRGLARFPYIRLQLENAKLTFLGDVTTREFRLANLPGYGIHDWETVFAGGANDVIHAGNLLEVARTKPRSLHSTARETEDITIKCEIAAEGVEPFRSTYVVVGQSMIEAMLAEHDRSVKAGLTS